MTKYEAVVISAYTGCLLCKKEDLAAYLSQKAKRNLQPEELTHTLMLEVHDAVLEDLMKLDFDGSAPDPRFPPPLHLV